VRTPKIIIVNSGRSGLTSSRGFTKNDQLTTSPFDDAFLYIPGVPLNVAKGVLPKLNNKTVNNKREVSRHTEHARTAERYGADVEAVYVAGSLRCIHALARRRAAKNLTLGYVPTIGYRFLLSVSHAYMSPQAFGVATTLYTPVAFLCIARLHWLSTQQQDDNAAIDLVFVDFIESLVLNELNALQTAKSTRVGRAELYENEDDEVLVFRRCKWINSIVLSDESRSRYHRIGWKC